MLGQGVLFLLWPPFARDPCHWFLEFVLLSFPGVQSVFFVAPRYWAPRPVGGARAKTTPRVFFSCSGPADRQGKEKRRWPPARGQSKKKDLSAGPEPKKKKHPGWCCFFALAPPTGLGAQRGATKKKNTLHAGRSLAHCGLGRPFRHCGPGRRCLPPGPPGWWFLFFFAAAPPGRSLTHCGLRRPFRQGPGVSFVFLLRPR